MQTKFFFFIFFVFLFCSSVFSVKYFSGLSTDFIYSSTGSGKLIYAPVLIRVSDSGSVGFKPVAGCYMLRCVSACESARLRGLFLWGCN